VKGKTNGLEPFGAGEERKIIGDRVKAANNSNTVPGGTTEKAWSSVSDAEREEGEENPFYYTTSYEIRVAKTLCVFIAANAAVLLSFTLNRPEAAGLGLVHGYVTGMIMSYLVFGINCDKRDRLVALAASTGILGPLAVLDWRLETVLVLCYSLLILAVTLRCLKRDRGKLNGDYGFFSERDYDRNWFDVAIEDTGKYPVLFPPDIGRGRGDRLSGRIVELGMGLRGKYRGIPVAKIEASSGFYLCPLSRLTPDSAAEWRGSVEIASRSGENLCTVTFYRHEYGGYTVVSGIGQAARING
jgi:hypothetical protein